jgi:hypothetical protein
MGMGLSLAEHAMARGRATGNRNLVAEHRRLQGATCPLPAAGARRSEYDEHYTRSISDIQVKKAFVGYAMLTPLK